jgi:FMN-dependent NADH-azoreductase
MSTFLLLECSPHGERSLGGQVAREAIEQFQFGRPEVRRTPRVYLSHGRICPMPSRIPNS